jgi:hypothetical protein
VNIINNPQTEKDTSFAKGQEAGGKMWSGHLVCSKLDCLFSVTQLEHGLFRVQTMHEVMTYCMIMHNMIAETEHPNGRNEHGWDF